MGRSVISDPRSVPALRRCDDDEPNADRAGVPVSLIAARSAIARAWPGDLPPAHTQSDAAARLGTIVLRPHQVDAVHQLRALLRTAGGALLADEVGLGKTYVALALAREATSPLVIAPAALRGMWERALSETATAATVISLESLSHARSLAGPLPRADLLIVDEAHHFRTPSTRRYRALATLAAIAPLLLLSATPVHNQARDLAALLALFLGARAWTLDDDRRAAYVVRRSHAVAGTRAEVPVVDLPIWLPVAEDADVLRELSVLPAPVPPRDGGDGGALLAHALIRQWASSAGALRAALRRRVHRAVAIAAALERGRYPSYRELRAWCAGEGAVQLAFPELLVPASAPDPDLLGSVRTHAAAVRDLLARLADRVDPDRERVALLRAVRERHPGAKIVAFSAYEDTVRSLYRLLRSDPGVCALRASGADVAGGSLSRVRAIARFAPAAAKASVPPPAERIDLLLTTDLLSEGVNLQDAAVVVHLDLPWTPARMEQRVGRVARLGSPHRRIAVYAVRPPASTEALLSVEQRLRTKIDSAARTVGLSGSILPASLAHTSSDSGPQPALDPAPAQGDATSPAQCAALARSIVARWRGTADAIDADPGDDRERTIFATAVAETDGLLAMALIGDRPVLVASLGGPITDRAPAVARAVALVDAAADAGIPDAGALLRARAAVVEWGDRRLARIDAGLADGVLARERRRVLARIAAITRRAPPHQRGHVGQLAERARAAALATGGVGAEDHLGRMARDAERTDDAWLRALAATYAPRAAPATTMGVRVGALILLRRGPLAARSPAPPLPGEPAP